MQPIRIYEMLPCKMVASQIVQLDSWNLQEFISWIDHQPASLFPHDFMTWDDTEPDRHGFRVLFPYDPNVTPPENTEIIGFAGGMYAVATANYENEYVWNIEAEVRKFLRKTGLELDDSRREMWRSITSPAVKAVLGYEQMEYYYPVRPVK